MVLGYLLLALGILWAPLGGLICQRLSRRNQHGRELMVSDGARASLQFLLPWFYVYLLARGKTLSGRLVLAIYALFFAMWFIGLVVAWEDRPPMTPYAIEGFLFGTNVLPSEYPFLILLANIGVWSWSLWRLVSFHWPRRGVPAPGHLHEIPPKYFQPFMLAAFMFPITIIVVPIWEFLFRLAWSTAF